VARLIACYARSGRLKATPYQRRTFGSLYTEADVELLACVDKWQENLSGPATKMWRFRCSKGCEPRQACLSAFIPHWRRAPPVLRLGSPVLPQKEKGLFLPRERTGPEK
jgi:hypothetical protein